MASTERRNNNVRNNELSEIKAIFFDLDNTLIPTRTGDAKACREVSLQIFLVVCFFFFWKFSTTNELTATYAFGRRLEM